MTDVSTLSPASIRVTTIGIQGPSGPPGPTGSVLAELSAAPVLSPVYLTDYVPVLSNGVLYRSTVASLLAALSPPGNGGQYDFSDPINSAFAALM